MKQSKTQPPKQDASKSEKRRSGIQPSEMQQVEPTIDYGFRWFYLLFPFIPTWLIVKSFTLLFWHIATSFFEHDDSPFAAFYTEDRSNRIAFLFLILFLVVFSCTSSGRLKLK